jgi:nonribosomal peptide synthetase DhbF
LLLDDPQTDTGQPEHNPAVPIQTGSAAYAIYTSGSTGTPKAAVTSHESLRNLLLWMQDAYPLRASDRVLQKTPSSFDVSVWEFFWPLVCGAGLVLARPGGHRDGGYLARLINRTQVTTLHFVPSMLRAFLDEPDLETSCGSLRDVICIGEELPADLVRSFTGRLDARLHNLYGPTEATIEVSAYTCRRDEPGPRVPIGVPIANTEWYVLDPDYQPVPVGVTGELHLGGIGLARGYLRRPGLTADRFVPDPFGNGSRLYRTGDLARYRADGSVDFLGRADQQVKIRGQRIEPAEIEAALRGQTGVGDAAVLARASDRGETELVAYVVPAGTDGQEGEADGQPLSEAVLLTGLRRCLTDAMIPSAVVVLDALPLTPNGKLDRKGLPSPPLTDRPYVAPRTAVELAIADIWADVFAMDRISVEDDFFALGGESLLATRTLARVRSTLGVELPLRVIFDRPTVGGLAAAVVAADRDEQ